MPTEKQNRNWDKHALLQTKRQSQGRLTFPPTGVRREKNVRVPKVLVAGALGKKHLQILFLQEMKQKTKKQLTRASSRRKQ